MNNESYDSNRKKIEIRRAIDKLCDEIESRWSTGESVEVAIILRDLDDDARPVFLKELLALDLDINGRDLNSLEQDYLNKIPDFRHLVEQIFADFRQRDELEVTRGSTRLVIEDDCLDQPIDFVGKKIGDYFVEEKLGGGGFGVVYLGRDEYLPRRVVIKIPILGRQGRKSDIDFFMDEARNASLLNHPNILKVLHVGLDSKLPYIVQEFFEGGDLRHALLNNRFGVSKTVDFIAKVASAIGYAHENRIIHRDLKPANILIDQNGDPVIADFGLSLYEPQLRGKEGEMVGTIRFMSPEQVRGEAHRLDGRTDIWSIGVILYLMLVDNYPFDGQSVKQISEAILFGRPCPLRQLNKDIPPELERICLKSLSVLVNDRYSTAFDLADDLRNLMRSPVAVPTQPSASDPLESPPERLAAPEKKRLIPKGLAAFDQSDCDFFLELLPGPKDRNGLPDNIRFWKDRIENPALSNPVSLLFGPSGCGKSSLVNAGLIPLLDTNIVVVNVESSPRDTEVRFLKALRNQVPSIPNHLSLPDLIAEIRRGKYLPAHRRIFVVFDQFEQWLHANVIDEHSQLIHALRQCDGSRVQALILAREDFWMAITRFFKQLEIELVERQNFASVDLFNKRHAKEVLTKYGQAYGNLPDDEIEISRSANHFLDWAVDLLAEKDAVICVRSALFAETVKNKTWDSETIKQIGNSKNIGVSFLEQALGDQAKNPKYKFYGQQLIGVLEHLLPSPGVLIKGSLKSKSSLASSVKLSEHGDDFASVIEILDTELRLITPTEPDRGIQQAEGSEFYQLAHDYLVPAIREWLHLQKSRTLAGRSHQRLQELAVAWIENKETRYLPGLFEFLSFSWNVPKRNLGSNEKQLLSRASKYFGIRILIASIFFGMFIFTWHNIVVRDSSSVVAGFLRCNPESIPEYLEMMERSPVRFGQLLNDQVLQSDDDGKQRSLIGIAALEQATNEQIDDLVQSTQSISPSESSHFINALSNYRDQVIPLVDTRLPLIRDASLRSKLSTIRMFLKPEDLLPGTFEFTSDPTNRTDLIHRFSKWRSDLNPLLKVFLENEFDAPTTSGIYQCLGGIRPSKIDDVDFSAIKQKAMRDLNSSKSALVHSSCEWLLRKWQVPFEITKSKLPVEGQQWWFDGNLTFVHIDAGQMSIGEKKINVERPYFIATTEVTAGLFQQFYLERKLYKDANSWVFNNARYVSKNCAVDNITYEEAVQFCNWMSAKAGLKNCYEPTDNMINVDQLGLEIPIGPVREWKLSNNCNGFRLPTRVEWEYAARAGRFSQDNFFHTNPYSEAAMSYFWNRFNSVKNRVYLIQDVGVTLPNRLGLFDVLGNVAEMYQPSEPIDENSFIHGLGGGSDISPDSCKFNHLSVTRLGRRVKYLGFRIVYEIDSPN